MGFIRFVLWTSMCIGLGVFVASYEVDGKTPAQHIRQIFKGAPKIDSAIEQAKLKLTAPTETHSAQDRDAINRLLAKRTK